MYTVITLESINKLFAQLSINLFDFFPLLLVRYATRADFINGNSIFGVIHK